MNISRARRIPTQTRQISPQTKITDCQWDGWSDKTKLCVKCTFPQQDQQPVLTDRQGRMATRVSTLSPSLSRKDRRIPTQHNKD